MATKITELEILNRIVSSCSDTDVIEWAKARITQKVTANEKAKATKATENKPIVDKVLEVLERKGGAMTVTEILRSDSFFNDNNVSSSKVTNVLGTLKKSGVVVNNTVGKSSVYAKA